jgi:hypothetical protein
MCNVIILRKEYLLDSGSSKDFGKKGYYEMYKITPTCSIIGFCPAFERNHVMMLGLHLWGFSC